MYSRLTGLPLNPSIAYLAQRFYLKMHHHIKTFQYISKSINGISNAG